MTRAATRGRTRTSMGLRPIVRSASISSRICMEPSSAVYELPHRPAIMIETMRTPISRRTRTPTRSTT